MSAKNFPGPLLQDSSKSTCTMMATGFMTLTCSFWQPDHGERTVHSPGNSFPWQYQLRIQASRPGRAAVSEEITWHHITGTLTVI